MFEEVLLQLNVQFTGILIVVTAQGPFQLLLIHTTCKVFKRCEIALFKLSPQVTKIFTFKEGFYFQFLLFFLVVLVTITTGLRVIFSVPIALKPIEDELSTEIGGFGITIKQRISL